MRRKRSQAPGSSVLSDPACLDCCGLHTDVRTDGLSEGKRPNKGHSNTWASCGFFPRARLMPPAPEAQPRELQQTQVVLCGLL